MVIDTLKRLVHRPAPPPDCLDAAAFAAVYTEQFDRIYTYLRFRVRDAALAEDLTAETFVRLWANRSKIDRAAAVLPWLFTTARNVTVDHVRRERATLSFDDLPLAAQPRAESFEEQVLTQDQLAIVLHHVAGLRERERDILGLRFVAGLRNAEIAPIIGISPGNVAKILHRTLATLRTQLSTSPAWTESEAHDDA